MIIDTPSDHDMFPGPRERPSDRAKRVGSRIAAFRALRVPFPPQIELIYEFDELRQVGLASRGEPQDAMIVIQETFAGKTTAAKRFRRYVLETGDYGPEDVPVPIATCAAGTSSRALVTALLRSLGVRLGSGMTEDAMWEIWPEACRRKKVEMVIIDEVQHCQDSKFTRGVTNTLKNKLATSVPIVCLGTRSAKAVFTTNDEFNSRIYSTLSLRTLTWDEDAEDWTRLCRALDAAMEKSNVSAAPSGLDEPDVARRLCEASLGRIGLLKKVLQTALRFTLREGREVVQFGDLQRAADVWSVKHRFVATNPFSS